MVNNIKNNSGTYYKSHKWRSPRPLMHSLLVIFTYCIIKLLPAGGFGVLAFAAPAGRQILDGLTLITHYSVWGRGGPPATLINDLLVWFASGRAVAGPDQMACDRLSCGAVHMQLVHRPGAQFTFHMHYRVKEMRHTSFWDNFFFSFYFPDQLMSVWFLSSEHGLSVIICIWPNQDLIPKSHICTFTIELAKNGCNWLFF